MGEKNIRNKYHLFGKMIFAIIGAVFGWWLVESITTFIDALAPDSSLLVACKASGGILFGVAGYFTAPLITSLLLKIYKSAEKWLVNYSPRQVFMGIIGFIFGLLITSGVHLLIIKSYIYPESFGLIVTIIIGVVLCFLGTVVGGNILAGINFSQNAPSGKQSVLANSSGIYILDTSTLIDGRILEIVRTGFVSGRVIIPDFIFRELSLVADSTDMLKKNKGRRGLDILRDLKKEEGIKLDIIDTDFTGGEVDTKIIKLAELCLAPIITVDFNLNKLAEIKNIKILNINDLSSALKNNLLPGEKLAVKIVKNGKERGQGLAYMEDGTMIVVENGGSSIGETVEITITTSYQTSAGRMVFARIATNDE